MPRTGIGALGIALLALTAACTSSSGAVATSTPTPVAVTPSASSEPSWVQNLDFSGDLSGRMVRVSSPEAGLRSECSGKNARTAGIWASSLYGPVGADVFGLVVLSQDYRGPGSYSQKVSVQVHNPENSRVWQNGQGDPVTFSVSANEESGSLDATLTNLTSGKTKLRVTGSWSCKT